MKFIFLAFLMSVTTSLFARTNCTIEIDEQTLMPEGSVETPANVISVMKAKGYKATLSTSPTATREGEYYTIPVVTCGNFVLNPWLTKCETRVRLYNHKDQVVAEGSTISQFSLGSYNGDVGYALMDLPNCKDL